MLPEHFKWTHVGASIDGPDRVLECKGYEVARIAQKVGGEWMAMLGKDANGRRITRDCTSKEQGMAGIELWAERHKERLLANADRRFAEWAAKQTWRASSSLGNTPRA